MTKQKTYIPATDGDKKFVSRLIKEARFARGLTPSEAAKAIGISRSVYYAWERGTFGASAAKVVCWLLRDRTDAHDPLYWRERALLAERRLSAINAQLLEYSKARRSIETDDDGSSPSSVSPREGSRVRAA